MFCEKCGNKIKKEYNFCDKCGAKIKEENKELETKKINKQIKNEEEKINKELEKNKEDNKTQEKIVVNYKNKKSGKGKIIFLSILNILLLASTVVFLVLWLTKPSSSCKSNEERASNYSNSSNKKNVNDLKEKAKESTIVGKWEQNIDYKQGNEVVKRTYGMINLKSDGTFNSVYYDKDHMSDSEKIDGTYTSNGNTVYLKYINENGESETTTLYIDNNKMCIKNRDCKDYLVKDSYNNKIVIYENDSDIEFINYSDYQKIINNKENALVVVVRNGCYYCEQYESVVEKIHDNYITPIYYYENDNNIEVTGTPTTFVIKNGEVVDTIIGYYEYSKIEEKLNSNNVF